MLLALFSFILQTPWLEFLNIKPIREKLVTMATSWRKTGTPEQNPKAKPAETNKKMNGLFLN